MRAHGLAEYMHVAEGDDSDVGGHRGARSLLSARPRPTAIFAFNDYAAIGALSAIEEAGLGVPEDISVIGYDDTHLASFPQISLTSVDQPLEEMGRLGVQVVSERLDHGHSHPRKRTLLAPRLVARSTTGQSPS